MEEVFTYGRMVENMKVCIRMIKNMAMEFIYGLMEGYILFLYLEI